MTWIVNAVFILVIVINAWVHVIDFVHVSQQLRSEGSGIWKGASTGAQVLFWFLVVPAGLMAATTFVNFVKDSTWRNGVILAGSVFISILPLKVLTIVDRRGWKTGQNDKA